MANPNALKNCPACGSPLRPALEEWLARCPRCGHWASTLGSADGRLHESRSLDERRRERGLAPIRTSNIGITLDTLAKRRPLDGLRLLDVGCAYGWFLAEAQRRGIVCQGIEPDGDIAAAARAQGLSVRTGYFPDVLDKSDCFDAVSFNDVLEHLVDLEGALAACRSVLAPGGFLLIAAPNSRGFLYRTATILARMGASAPLHRLWQEGFPSPHVSYFSPESLDRLLAKHDFVLDSRQRLLTLSNKGLAERIAFDGRRRVAPMLTASMLAAATPALNFLLPPDLLLAIYRKST